MTSHIHLEEISICPVDIVRQVKTTPEYVIILKELLSSLLVFRPNNSSRSLY